LCTGQWVLHVAEGMDKQVAFVVLSIQGCHQSRVRPSLASFRHWFVVLRRRFLLITIASRQVVTMPDLRRSFEKME
jgi:hypothetical protein